MPFSAPDLPIDCSHFLQRLVARHPEWPDRLKNSGRLSKNSPPDRTALEQAIEQHGLDAGLRRFRQYEMLRIVWRELSRTAGLADTLSDLTTLAETCLDAAIKHHQDTLAVRFGQPRDEDGQPVHLSVIGLGKLGGRELNLSSDIDIVFCFRAAGETTGPRRLANEQWFRRLSQAVIRSLGDVTEDGFCFRVDTRLRPFGEAGPLVCSFGAMEQYYQREGRDWERYALVKARPVAGDREAGQALLKSLQPFIYRRYIDFGAVEALRDMRKAVRDDARRQGREQDLKRGGGGIRDIEFLVQCLQLLRGGREHTLRTPSLFEALNALRALDLLPDAQASELYDDYVLLRRAENAVQALNDQQVHRLPADPDDLARVAQAMGLDSTTELTRRIGAARRRVQRVLDAHFPEPEPTGEGEADWRRTRDEAELALADRLDRMALSQRAARRLDRFMPLLLSRLREKNTPLPARQAVFDLVAGICRRSAYLALLVENPGALDRMIELFTRSDWIADAVIRHPALLDELIDPALGQSPPDPADWSAHVARLLDGQPDEESAVQALNYLKQSASLRIAVGELSGNLTAEQAQSLLTALAEVLLDALLRLATDMLEARHGRPPGSRLVLVGYGTLGAGEMSYASDLDLIFLYHNGGKDSMGDRPLAPETWFTRLARRLLGLATLLTPAGRLYDIDTRLRPNGRAGLLVSSLEAFERYQAEDAWPWELQALVRARAVAGDDAAGARFQDIRRQVLGQARDPEHWRTSIRDMRARIRETHGRGDSPKHRDGGLVDIGFVAQLGTLLNAADHPALLDTTGTQASLKALLDAGWLEPGEADELIRCHQVLVQSRHRQALARSLPGNPTPDEPDTRVCAALCRARLGEAEAVPPGAGGLE